MGCRTPHFRLRVAFVAYALAAALSGVPAVSAEPPATPPASTQPSGREVYLHLRDVIVKQDPAKQEAYTKEHAVWGVMAEFVTRDQPVTIVAIADGNASIYLGSGGGFIGGFAHESCQQAAKSFCAVADPLVPKAKPVKELPLPNAGEWQFYILTRDGAVRLSASEQDVRDPKHELHSLFRGANGVMTAYREIDEAKKK